MKIESFVFLLNDLVNKGNYPRAKRMILDNMSHLVLPHNHQALNTEAKYLFKTIQTEMDQDTRKLSTDDILTLNTINRYVKQLQFQFARKAFQKNRQLLENPEARKIMTADTMCIYEAWLAVNEAV